MQLAPPTTRSMVITPKRAKQFFALLLSINHFPKAHALEEHIAGLGVVVLVHEVGKLFGILLCENSEASLDGLGIDVEPPAHAVLGFGTILFDLEVSILDEWGVTEVLRLLAVLCLTNPFGLFNPVPRPALEGTGQQVFHPLHSNVEGHHYGDKRFVVFHMLTKEDANHRWGRQYEAVRPGNGTETG